MRKEMKIKALLQWCLSRARELRLILGSIGAVILILTLWLRGAQWLEVKEDTDEIDRLIRAAASTVTIASKWIKSDNVNCNLEQGLNTPIGNDWMADGCDRTPLAH